MFDQCIHPAIDRLSTRVESVDVSSVLIQVPFGKRLLSVGFFQATNDCPSRRRASERDKKREKKATTTGSSLSLFLIISGACNCPSSRVVSFDQGE